MKSREMSLHGGGVRRAHAEPRDRGKRSVQFGVRQWGTALQGRNIDSFNRDGRLRNVLVNQRGPQRTVTPSPTSRLVSCSTRHYDVIKYRIHKATCH